MKSIRSADPVYRAIEAALKGAAEPMTAPQLFEVAEVARHVESINVLSDRLGHMWRRGLLARYAATPDGASMARWAYSWKPQAVEKPQPVLHEAPAVAVRTAPAEVTVLVGGLRVTIRVEPA